MNESSTNNIYNLLIEQKQINDSKYLDSAPWNQYDSELEQLKIRNSSNDPYQLE